MEHSGMYFDMSTNPPRLVNHHFMLQDGKLVHMVEDQIRAIVPKESFERYFEQWPMAKKCLPEGTVLTPVLINQYLPSIGTVLMAL